jgi:hypothetical protein
LNADRGFTRHALDQDALRAQPEAQVLCKPGDAVVLDARLGLEFIGRDHRAGIDVSDLAHHIELRALAEQVLSQTFQLFLIDRVLFIGAMQEEG